MKTEFEKFSETFFSKASFSFTTEGKALTLNDTLIKWFDKKGVIQLGKGMFAEIIIGHQDEYNNYVVKIASLTQGEITITDFLFQSYLNEKIDNPCNLSFEINRFSGVCWGDFEPDPKEVKEMAEAILQYIAEYATPDMPTTARATRKAIR